MHFIIDSGAPISLIEGSAKELLLKDTGREDTITNYPLDINGLKVAASVGEGAFAQINLLGQDFLERKEQDYLLLPPKLENLSSHFRLKILVARQAI